MIKCIYFMMRVGVTKVYILPKAAIVTGLVYMVWFVSPISCSTLEKKMAVCQKSVCQCLFNLSPYIWLANPGVETQFHTVTVSPPLHEVVMISNKMGKRSNVHYLKGWTWNLQPQASGLLLFSTIFPSTSMNSQRRQIGELAPSPSYPAQMLLAR